VWWYIIYLALKSVSDEIDMMLTVKFHKSLFLAFPGPSDIKSGLCNIHRVTVLIAIHDRCWVKTEVCQRKLDLVAAVTRWIGLCDATTIYGVLVCQR
jgi:hypothetical protein